MKLKILKETPLVSMKLTAGEFKVIRKMFGGSSPPDRSSFGLTTSEEVVAMSIYKELIKLDNTL